MDIENEVLYWTALVAIVLVSCFIYAAYLILKQEKTMSKIKGLKTDYACPVLFQDLNDVIRQEYQREHARLNKPEIDEETVVGYYIQEKHWHVL